MFELILLIVAFSGSLAAGIIDLKTTEIPDEIPYVMIGVGVLLHVVQSFMTMSYLPILYSVVAGLGFLLFGFFMYYTGQWGGGDAKLLSALGFLLPILPTGFGANLFFPFSLSYFFNVFFIGAAYMIIYAVVLAFMNKKIWYEFFHEIKANSRMLILLNVAITFVLILFGVFAVRYVLNLTFLDLIKIELRLVLITVGIFLLWRFSKTVENVGFKKRIPLSELKIGDVLLDSNLWEGVTKEQMSDLKKSGQKHVWVKEGVRFGLAFPLALAFTLLLGDGIILILGLI